MPQLVVAVALVPQGRTHPTSTTVVTVALVQIFLHSWVSLLGLPTRVAVVGAVELLLVELVVLVVVAMAGKMELVLLLVQPTLAVVAVEGGHLSLVALVVQELFM
jgi:hypothetical protein